MIDSLVGPRPIPRYFPADMGISGFKINDVGMMISETRGRQDYYRLDTDEVNAMMLVHYWIYLTEQQWLSNFIEK